MINSNTAPDDVGFSAKPGELEPGPIVIVGAGLAGLFTALKLAPTPVTVVSAAPLGKGAASAWAQGGIAAAVGEGDSVYEHAFDTVTAGAGLVDPDIASMVAGEAPARIFDLLEIGVPFDRSDEGDFLLSREAAHSENRIVRVSGDKAGAAIMATLIARVRATPSIRVLEGFVFEDLTVVDGRVTGLQLSSCDGDGSKFVSNIATSAVVLATGGIGALYHVTTNPSYALGTSLAVAARSGALISDAEFMQFHPTALDFDMDPAPLATESLRGDGARLIDGSGERFMAKLHEDGELAPRDIVARGVFAQNVSGQGAFLDCRDAIGDDFEKLFPTVFRSCQQAGFDPATQPLPVVTAAHYHMGGIATDMRARSSVRGLWAVGEVAATGLHGANRLASNSLLETLVFGARAATDIASLSNGCAHTHEKMPLRKVSTRKSGDKNDGSARSAAFARLREIMSNHVGVIRNASGLRRAAGELREIEENFAHDMLMTNIALAARFVAVSSLAREESRGSQFRSDFPEVAPGPGLRSYFTLSQIEGLEEAGEHNGRSPQPALGGQLEPAHVVAAAPA